MPTRSDIGGWYRPSGEVLLPQEASRLWGTYVAGLNPFARLALGRLYRALQPGLIAFCRRKGFSADLAEEVAQQVWIRLMVQKPQSRSLIALLRKTAQNLGFMALRKRPVMLRMPREEPGGDPAADAERGEMRQAMRDSLASLNVEDRAFLLACDVDGMTRREACQRLGWDIAASTAYQRHVRIRAELAAALEKKDVSLRKND